ncbi:MAG: AAA family ATPase [Candidatus Marinimicrobia bacterium]|jgi:predicted AAA+ superfamily ATPase|nr:AAA family ATPase [Candidatus Neomarinimicrobiota bacterium]
MKRLFVNKLIEWKDNINRKPLMLRGARQVGKTWMVRNFGNKYFKNRTHIIDFEKHSDWHTIFDKNLDVKRIISELELVLNTSIDPERDLLFFDEIQSCPRAIMSLRYFYEELPKLHIIAAGSLLEFALKEISFPVGRVQFLNMYPMTFVEFLLATGKNKMAEILLENSSDFPTNIHLMFLEELRLYFFVGGMPECVKTYKNTGKLKNVSEIQTGLIETYRADFSKYEPYADKRCINSVLTNVSQSIGKQIKYTHLTQGFTSPTNKKAFDLLNMAQIIYKISSVSPAGLPLGALASERKFKAIMVDIGLMQHLCGINISEEIYKTDLLNIYNGALAEQFVGQELLASSRNELYYWSRDAKSSSAEVDYLIERDGKILPIEVKSGVAGKLKSLHLLLKKYPNISTAFVLSARPYSELPKQKLIFYPLYCSGRIGL